METKYGKGFDEKLISQFKKTDTRAVNCQHR
jgi:hypothetical protein